MVNTKIATPTLQLGAQGAAVKDLQELLLTKVNIFGLTALTTLISRKSHVGL